MHSQLVCHRDLKPENFVLSGVADIECANLRWAGPLHKVFFSEASGARNPRCSRTCRKVFPKSSPGPAGPRGPTRNIFLMSFWWLWGGAASSRALKESGGFAAACFGCPKSSQDIKRCLPVAPLVWWGPREDFLITFRHGVESRRLMAPQASEGTLIFLGYPFL